MYRTDRVRRTARLHRHATVDLVVCNRAQNRRMAPAMSNVVHVLELVAPATPVTSATLGAKLGKRYARICGICGCGSYALA